MLILLAFACAACSPASLLLNATPTAPPLPTPTAVVSDGNLANGKRIVDSKGCSACHVIDGPGGTAGPNLTAVGARLTTTQIADQIRDPKQRPAPYTQMNGNAAMPKPDFADDDALVGDAAAYLASLKGT